jgi:hypothetical protein
VEYLAKNLPERLSISANLERAKIVLYTSFLPNGPIISSGTMNSALFSESASRI